MSDARTIVARLTLLLALLPIESATEARVHEPDSPSPCATCGWTMPSYTRARPKKRTHFVLNAHPEDTHSLWQGDDPDRASLDAFYPGRWHRHMRPEVWCLGTALTGSACIALAREWDCGFGAFADNMDWMVEGEHGVLDEEKPIRPSTYVFTDERGRVFGDGLWTMTGWPAYTRIVPSPYLHLPQVSVSFECSYKSGEHRRRCDLAVRRYHVCHFLQMGTMAPRCLSAGGIRPYSSGLGGIHAPWVADHGPHWLEEMDYNEPHEECGGREPVEAP